MPLMRDDLSKIRTHLRPFYNEIGRPSGPHLWMDRHSSGYLMLRILPAPRAILSNAFRSVSQRPALTQLSPTSGQRNSIISSPRTSLCDSRY